MSRGAGFWPGGRERSVPQGFPGSGGPGEDPTVEEPRPRARPRPNPSPSPSPSKRVVPRADAERNRADAARSRRVHPAASLLASSWPGTRPTSVPADFPARGAGGKIVFKKQPDPVLAAEPELGEVLLRATRTRPELVPEPITLVAAETPSGESRLPNKRRTSTTERLSAKRRPSPLRPPQRLNSIVAAVYAALADPLAADSAEEREQRAARVREVGLLAASTALVAVLIYGIFPVRTFLDQRSSTAEAEERLEKLSEANERLKREAEQLRDDDEIEMRARSDYGWVFPGEESYGVTPPPVAPTTTTTAP